MSAVDLFFVVVGDPENGVAKREFHERDVIDRQRVEGEFVVVSSVKSVIVKGKH